VAAERKSRRTVRFGGTLARKKAKTRNKTDVEHVVKAVKR